MAGLLRMIQLTDKQRSELKKHPDGILFRDEATQHSYVIVDEIIHREAMLALQRQQDLEAIRRGVAQMEAGEGIPLEEARRQLARELGFSERA